MYNVQTGDIAQIVANYEQLNVVKMMNVFHYRYVGVPTIADGPAALARLVSTFEVNPTFGGWTNLWQGTAAVLTSIDSYDVQKIYPVRYAKINLDVAVTGARTGNPLPGFSQWGIVKRGEIAARYAVGGVRVPGLSEDDEQGGQILDAHRPACQDLAEFLEKDMVTSLGETWEPIVLRRLTPSASVRVTEAFINPTLSTQRTRISFRGI